MIKICENGGFNPKLIMNELSFKNEFYFGFDAFKENFGNMFDMGILDPTKVVVSTLRDATSVASLMLTTEATVVRDEAPMNSLLNKK